jgi:hypothetical protein
MALPRARVLAAALVLALAHSVQADETTGSSRDRTHHVWIVAGQSNSMGWSNGNDAQPLPGAAQPLPGRILMLSSSCDSSAAAVCWRDAVAPIHASFCSDGSGCSRMGAGPGIPFARALLELNVSSAVGLVPAAASGTSIKREWAPGGQLFTGMVARAKAGVQAAAAAAALNSSTGAARARLAGLLWVQGEGDGDYRASEPYLLPRHGRSAS